MIDTMKKCIPRVVIGLSLWFCVLCGHADVASHDVLELLSNIRTMKAEFDQTIIDEQANVLQRSKGEMAFSRPDKFRWETISPMHQLLLTDGVKIWMYDVDLEQITVKPLDKSQNNRPAQLLSGDLQNFTSEYKVQKIADSPQGALHFVFLPKESNSSFARIELLFDPNFQDLQTMMLVDNLGQKTLIHFKHVVTNPLLEVSLFKFTPPKGVDMVGQL